jgi:hypothetical protein
MEGGAGRSKIKMAESLRDNFLNFTLCFLHFNLSKEE